MIADALVVGGGLQGLVVLRALTAAGHLAVLVTDGDLGSGQTLHAHGLLDSGTGLVTGETEAELVEHVLPELRALGVPVASAAPSYLSLLPAVVEQLRAPWAARPEPPRPVDPGEVDGLRLPGPVFRVTAHHTSKRALVGALADGLHHRMIRGRLVGADGRCRIRLSAGGGTFTISAGVVVVAAGCGTPRLLAETLGGGASLVARLGHVRTHMLCLRAPAGVLPAVGTVVAPGLAIVAHQRADGAALWYVTPQTGDPERLPEVPDDAHAEVDPQVVAAGVARLRELVPVLAGRDPQVEATAFAGFKQDVDGRMTQRLVQALPGDPPVVVAVPSVYAGAWANARDVVRLLGAPETPRGGADALDAGPGQHPVGRENEDLPDVRWTPWQEWTDG